MQHCDNKLGRLSESELEVMRAVWGLAAPVTVSRVLEIFSARRGWKTSTLSTIMDRLIEKGYLTKKLQGKTNIYTPTLSETTFKEHHTRDFLSTVHNGSIRSFVAALADGGNLRAEEIRDS